MKKNLKLFVLLLLPMMMACDQGSSVSSIVNTSSAPSYSVLIDAATVTLDPGDFHTEMQYAYLHSDYSSALEFAKGTEELSKPRAITVNVGDGDNYIEYSLSSDMADSKVKSVTDGKYDFKNVFMATTYYYRSAATEDGLTSGEIKSFTTADYGPRNLDVDGITNVRDIGGRMTASGKRMKQGLLYRGGRLNATAVDTYEKQITEAGEETFKNELGIKTELDLRTLARNESGLVPAEGNVTGVDYLHIEIDSTMGNYMEKGKAAFLPVYQALADSTKYPCYFHCDIGTDRTGLIAFMILNLCGVSKVEIYQDYLFSNFANIKGPRRPSTFDDYYTRLDAYGKGSDQLNTEAYFLDCGLTQEQINTLKTNLIEA